MSIGDLIRRPDMALKARGRDLTSEQREEIESMRETANEGLDEATAALEVIADYLYCLGEAKQKDDGELNNVSWSVKAIADIIGSLKLTISDCDYHLKDRDKGTAKRRNHLREADATVGGVA